MSKTNLTSSQLRTLIAIAETGSFTLAAQRLGLTQPGISHGIRDLEAILGVRLFERRRGEGAIPTQAGKRALVEARAALVHLERLEHAAHSEAALLSGRLRLACFPSAASTQIPAVLAEYHRLHPNVELEVLEDGGTVVERALRSREVDLGMMTLPSPNDLIVFPTYQDELLVVFREDDDLARLGKGRISPRALVEKPFLMPDDVTKNLIAAAFSTTGVEPRVVLNAQDDHLLLELVRQGIGITILPSNLLEPGRLNGLKTLGLKPRVLRHVVFAAVSLESLTPAASAFLKLLETQSNL